MKSNRKQQILFLIALFWLALVLRSIIATLPPALPTVQSQLQLSDVLAGATTTIPLVCFGVFAFVTPSLQKRFGITASMTLALTLIALGTIVRIFPTTPILIFSTLCIGIGTALTNVLFPVTLRNHYPSKIALAMGVFTFIINIGAGLGSISTPFFISLGMSWNMALSLWSIPAILVIVFWLLSHSNVVNLPFNSDSPNSNHYVEKISSCSETVVSENDYDNMADPTVYSENECYIPDGNEEKMHETKYLPWGSLLRMPVAWTIAGFMGIQGLIYYNLMTWLPTIFESTGFDTRMNSVLFGVFNTIAILGSLVGPKISTSKNPKLVSIIFYAIYVLTALSFPIGGWFAIVGSVVAGICQGVTYTMGLTLIASQPDPATVPSVSAFSQGVGYILAAIGPVLMGGLYTLSGNWWVPIFSIVLAMVLNCFTFIVSKSQMDKAQLEYDMA